MRTIHPSRRTVLRFLAASGGAAALGWPRGARAEGEPIRRVIFFVTSHGTLSDVWRAPLGATPVGQDAEVDLTALDEDAFGAILSPLYRHRTKLLGLDGLAMTTALQDSVHLPHETGHLGVLTGSLASYEGGVARAPSASLDVILGSRLAREGQVKSLQLGYQPPEYPLSWSEAGQAVPVELDPVLASQRLFPGRALLPSGLRQRAVEAAADRLEAWLKRAPSADLARVEAHASLLRDLQVRLGAGDSGTCAVPPAPPDAPEALHGPEAYAARTTASMQIAVAGLACDATRVVSIAAGTTPGALLGVPGADTHQEWAHNVETDAFARDQMVGYHARHASELASLLDALDDTPDGDGTLLDHTTVVWLNELATGPHRLTPYPALIAGGDAFRLGRFLSYGPRTASTDKTAPERRLGPAHNQLLVSIAQSVGVDVDQVGDATATATDGSTVSLTGSLDRLV